ncbi:hypothetical protein HETIRDRAFT_470622 [Heterobasidion irregulare TC 32-1]|uniref:Uncharacterized protein n=1 Tax=Heterobasidion irregulare (strain TC 32-1) TaxID=747525 RepID=W4KJQ5_HETIT|nr:uncharacterized protein HETIRDRAFT_470622 [Heterobasidion irregulare TC 32-1]ETW85555.1 hypothetical protein HETIRDRAFT_470622 [Heterobasidion irregulare TC 32-1]
MAGPNLEVFKFAVYVFFPVLVFLHYGDPEWYNSNVLPYKERIFPSEEKTTRNLPTHHLTVREELERIKAQKAARRVQRDRAEGRVVEEPVTGAQGTERLV